MSKADVSDAFGNVRVDPDNAHNLCYTVGELIVIEFRRTFAWSGSPGFWGVMSVAAEHAHCHTTIKAARLLNEGVNTMAHVKIMGSRKTHTRPRRRKNHSAPGRGGVRPFF